MRQIRGQYRFRSFHPTGEGVVAPTHKYIGLLGETLMGVGLKGNAPYADCALTGKESLRKT